MGSGFTAALSAVGNVLLFGGITWGALARTTDQRRRLKFALGVPVLFNSAVLLFKDSLTMEQRVWGAAATAMVCIAAVIWLQRRVLRAS